MIYVASSYLKTHYILLTIINKNSKKYGDITLVLDCFKNLLFVDKTALFSSPLVLVFSTLIEVVPFMAACFLCSTTSGFTASINERDSTTRSDPS